MATPMDRPKSNDVARCLNALALMNMQHIASSDILNELVSDYFVTRPIGNDDILLSTATTFSFDINYDDSRLYFTSTFLLQ